VPLARPRHTEPPGTGTGTGTGTGAGRKKRRSSAFLSALLVPDMHSTLRVVANGCTTDCRPVRYI